MTATAVPATEAAAPVRVETPEPGILLLTLAQPKSRNSLSMALMEALHAAILAAGCNAAVRAVVIAADGPAFSAGHDLKELTAHRADPDGGRAFFAETMSRCSALMQAIVACPKPVIAAVHATATAAGCQLAASSDLAVAGAHARFCTPGVNIGLFCSTPMVALTRNVPRKRAMEMLLLGELIGAEEAAQWGLVNRVVPDADVLPTALGLARQIAARSPATVAIGKQAFYTQIEQPLAGAYDFAAETMVRNMMLADANEGICAFIDKRKPEWQGR